MQTFKAKVLQVVKGIPRGKTMTYGEVAYTAGKRGAARAVGTIMANNTDPSIPCHRVIRADGKIGGYNTINGPSKEALLRAEGAVPQ
jgi:methylated-DNA-[protein]-cysteine S-methyltransferase